jgi:hypothetical protein
MKMYAAKGILLNSVSENLGTRNADKYLLNNCKFFEYWRSVNRTLLGGAN